ncbi:hypothetical protein ACFQZC_26895 [Streptacidiphilus monticola]
MEPWLDGPWSVRLARGTRGRSALEVYNRGLLVDVLVDAQLARRVLRGARRGEGTALAWGCAPRTAASRPSASGS